MIGLALDAVTGFSTAPLRFASHASVLLAGASLLLLFYIAWGFFEGAPVQGWTSTMLVVVVLSAAQMFVLGMIGEYLGRLYVESKRRPLYLVADVVGPVQGRATLGYRAEPIPTVRPEPVEGLLSAHPTAQEKSSASTSSAQTEN